MDIVIQHKTDENTYTPLYPDTAGNICDFDNTNSLMTSTPLQPDGIHHEIPYTTAQMTMNYLDEHLTAGGRNLDTLNIPFYLSPDNVEIQSDDNGFIVVMEKRAPIVYIWNGQEWNCHNIGDWNSTSDGAGAVNNVKLIKCSDWHSYLIVQSSRFVEISYSLDSSGDIQYSLTSYVPPMYGQSKTSYIRVSKMVSGAFCESSSGSGYIIIGFESGYSSSSTPYFPVLSMCVVQEGNFSALTLENSWALSLGRTGNYTNTEVQFMIDAADSYIFAVLNNGIRDSMIWGYNVNTHQSKIYTLVYDICGITTGCGYDDYDESNIEVTQNALYLISQDSNSKPNGYYVSVDFINSDPTFHAGNFAVNSSNMQKIYSLNSYISDSTYYWVMTGLGLNQPLIAIGQGLDLGEISWDTFYYGENFYQDIPEYDELIDYGDFTIPTQTSGYSGSSAYFYIPFHVIGNSVGNLEVVMSDGHIIPLDNNFQPNINDATELRSGRYCIGGSSTFPYIRKVISSPYMDSSVSTGSPLLPMYLAIGGMLTPSEWERVTSSGGSSTYLPYRYSAISFISVSINGKDWISINLSDTECVTDLKIIGGRYWWAGIDADNLTPMGHSLYMLNETYRELALGKFTQLDSTCFAGIVSNQREVLFYFGNCNLKSRGSGNNVWGHTIFGLGDIDNGLINSTVTTVDTDLYVSLIPSSGTGYYGMRHSRSGAGNSVALITVEDNNSISFSNIVDSNLNKNYILGKAEMTTVGAYMVYNNYYAFMALNNFVADRLNTSNINSNYDVTVLLGTPVFEKDACMAGIYYIPEGSSAAKDLIYSQLIPLGITLPNGIVTNSVQINHGVQPSVIQPLYGNNINGDIFLLVYQKSNTDNIVKYVLYRSETIR